MAVSDSSRRTPQVKEIAQPHSHEPLVPPKPLPEVSALTEVFRAHTHALINNQPSPVLSPEKVQALALLLKQHQNLISTAQSGATITGLSASGNYIVHPSQLQGLTFAGISFDELHARDGMWGQRVVVYKGRVVPGYEPYPEGSSFPKAGGEAYDLTLGREVRVTDLATFSYGTNTLISEAVGRVREALREQCERPDNFEVLSFGAIEVDTRHPGSTASDPLAQDTRIVGRVRLRVMY